MPAVRQLSIRLPSGGAVTLLDLAGRVVVRQIVGQREFREGMTVRIPASFPAGVYVVRFRGTAGTVERMAAVY
ncbi:MAG: hypothetical protein JW863_04820 [Chitinispirillaceae bacterium]|nr:hypothetical protein [Chitinispirillaceae bacterium]